MDSNWSGRYEDVSPNGLNGFQGSSAEDLNAVNTENFSDSSLFNPFNGQLLLQLNQQNKTPEDALSMLREMAQNDDAYKELYIQLLAERENQERAYKWYEDFNNSYFQRTSEDLKKSGLNPWLALQSLGSAGSGSLSPAGSWSGSSGSTISGQKQRQQLENKSQVTQKVVGGIATVIAAIAGALIMALL